MFKIPADLPEGKYTLTVRNRERLFAELRQTFSIGMAKSAVPKTDLKKVRTKGDSFGEAMDVVFFPEGGVLVAGLANRVYFACHDTQGHPISLSGVLIAKGRSANVDVASEQEIAAVKTPCAGMGSFRFVPQAGEAYYLKINEPKGVKKPIKLPAASVECSVALTTDAGVVDAGKPLEFEIRATKAGLPLVVAAYCRGIQIGQQPLVTKADAVGATSGTISSDSTIGGVVRLVAYDYSISPPKIVAERFVYRQPSRKLSILATGLKKTYSPGEEVQCSLAVTNEQGEPVQAVLGMSVINMARLQEIAGLQEFEDAQASLPIQCLLMNDVPGIRHVESIDASFAEKAVSSGGVSPAVVLDLLLNLHGPQPKIAKKTLCLAQTPLMSDVVRSSTQEDGPPAMSDNIGQIRTNYEKSLTDYQADRTMALNTITTAGFFGGLGLVLLVAMLGLMRIVSGIHLWIPAIGATTCCLIIGAILMDPSQLSPAPVAAAAFASYRETPTELVQGGPDRSSSPTSPAVDRTAPVESWHWKPLLVTNSDGKTTVRFKLPEITANYRILIDAHGDSRIGDGRIGAIAAEIAVAIPITTNSPNNAPSDKKR
jgi:hypothetical protein